MALVDLKSNLSTAFKRAPVDVFPDRTSGAKGFTENFTDPNDTKFIGVKGRQFIYPVTVTGIHRNSVMEVATGNSRFDSGIAKLNNQLGTGSPFYYLTAGGARAVKKFSNEGYSETRTYSSVVNSGISILGIKATEQNSPSALEEQYKKYNLQDDSYNYSYIRHPLVLRGIQRKERKEPQRWGIDALTNFDDGSIRGGATTVAERSAVDYNRIAKWMASPKGLLWVVKQAGLGLSNPNVEKSLASTLLGVQQTKVHNGLNTLLSVPGTPLGLHYTRHGIPFANEAASYENVIRANNLIGTYSRLINLRTELLSSITIPRQVTGISSNPFSINTIKALNQFKGLPIVSLSGPTGPQSVYGVGATPIRRSTNTMLDSITRASTSEFNQRYTSKSQYLPLYRASTGNVNDAPINIAPSETIRQFEDNNINSLVKQVESIKDVATDGNILNEDLSTSKTRTDSKKYQGAPFEGINSYMTLAYGKLKDRSSKTREELKGDFRNAFKDDKVGYTGYRKDSDYISNNLETKYGFGNLGQVGANRTDPDNFLVKSSDRKTFDGTNDNRFVLANFNGFRGDKITAIDRSSQKSGNELQQDKIYPEGAEDLIEFYFEDGDKGYSVMPFRATITGLSDSFSPGWNRIDIMGRPDGAYLYSSFERSLSFTFTVAALSRSEMIPMWRKLNYLASYTMPDFNASGGRPNGPFMRLTLGDMFKRCPGFLETLTYTVPDEATWDIAQDKATNKDAKQLPTIIEASVTFKVIHDQRPQLHGQVYYLNDNKGGKSSGPNPGAGNWLPDYEGGDPNAYKNSEDEKSS